MDMKNRLPGIRTRVGNQTITGLRNFVLGSQSLCDGEQTADQDFIPILDLVDGGDMFPRDKENMYRSCWLVI